MLYPLREQNPDKRFIPVSRMAICPYMKMITLPKLRDALVHMAPQVHVAPVIAAEARIPIERMSRHRVTKFDSLYSHGFVTGWQPRGAAGSVVTPT